MGSSKLRILAGLAPFLTVALAFAVAFGLQERSLRHQLELERQTRNFATLPLERSQELVERAEKYGRLPDPDDARLQDIAGMAETAVDMATDALAKLPDLEEAHRIRGRALEILGNFEEARTDYLECLETNPHSPARFHLGVMAIRNLARNRLTGSIPPAAGDDALRDRAIGSLRRYQAVPAGIAFEVDMKRRMLCTACIAFAMGDGAATETAANAAEGFDETEWLPPYLRGLARHERGEHDAALADLDRAARNAPAVADPHAWRGRVLLALDRKTEALEALSTALRIDPRFAEACLVRGTLLRDENRLAEAYDDFQVCARLRPDMPQLPWKLGTTSYELWQRTGRSRKELLETADASITRHLAAAPDDPAARLLRARVRIPLGNLDGAAADLAQAPASSDTRILRTALHEARNDWPKAEDEYSAAIEQASSSEKSAFLQGRARARTRQGKFDAALADYDALLAADPRNTGLFCDKALVELQAGRPDEALATTDRALRINPQSALVHAMKAEILLSKDDPAAAAQESETALKIDPLMDRALLARGRARLRQGRREEAIADWKRALEIRPDLAKEIKALIETAEKQP